VSERGRILWVEGNKQQMISNVSVELQPLCGETGGLRSPLRLLLWLQGQKETGKTPQNRQ